METLTVLERQIENLRRTLEASPDDAGNLRAYAEACLRRDQRLEALQAYQRLLKVEETPDAHLALARLFARQGHYAEAYAQLRRLFALDPQDLGGHAMIVWLQKHEPVPDDLSGHVDFVPGRDQAATARQRLEEERDQLASEVDQYRALTSGPDPEPILLYHLEESRKRVERVIEELERVEQWERVAGDAPVLHGTPRAPLVSPTAEGDSPAESGAEEPAGQAPAPTAGAPSEERRAFYEGLAGRMSDVLGRVGQTRGVTASLVVSRDPWLVHQVGQDGDLQEALGEIAAGVQALVGFADALQYWVLECADGIVVIQRLDDLHLLVVVGKSGANFGALRYAIDKLRPELADLLSGAPAA